MAAIVVKISDGTTMSFDDTVPVDVIKKVITPGEVDDAGEDATDPNDSAEQDDAAESDTGDETEPDDADDVVVKALAKLVASEQAKNEEAASKFTQAVANLDANASLDELSGLIGDLISETKKSRKASADNTEALVSVIGEVVREMKLARTTPFEITVDGNGNKTMSRTRFT